MKKILAILMALAMLFSFAACGEEDNDEKKKDKKPKETQSVEIDENEDINITEKPVEKKLSKGVISGNTYTNEFSDISFTKPTDWTFASDEQLSATVGQSLELFDMDIDEAILKNTSYYDAMAVSPSGENVIFAFENLKATNSVNITIEEYFVNFKKMSEETGITLSFGSLKKDKLCGKSFYSSVASAQVNGSSVYQKYYMTIEGEIVILVSVTVKDANGFDKIEAMFVEAAVPVNPVSPVNPVPPVEVTPPVEQNKLSRGTITGDVYKNAFADITFSKPYDWTFSSDKELMESVNAGFDLMNVTDLEAALAKQACIYDMMAESADSTSNVLVMFGSGEIGLDEYEYSEMLKEELASYASSGVYYDFGNVTAKSFGGQTYYLMPLVLNDSVYQNMYIRVIDDIVIVVTLTTADKANFTNLEAMFS